MHPKEAVIDNAKRHLNIPYIWGGNNPLQGFDCSGFIQWVLKTVGIDPRGDQTAQALYYHFKENFSSPVSYIKPDKGALVFYGSGFENIIHVSLALDDRVVIEAGGGGSDTKTIEDAIRRGACVRERPWNHRKDVVAIIMPDYDRLVSL